MQNHMFRLRRGLPDGVIESVGTGYRLDPDGIDVDIERLGAIVAIDAADDASRRELALLLQRWRGSAYPELEDTEIGQVENGRLEELENYESWCDCAQSDEDRVFLRRLIDDRNPQLADHIAAEHHKGRRVFAAVGALHMTGPLALPTLLAKAGFTVERVDFAAP